MDLQVAIFLLIFLSISSLATIGICFVELRSCWRNYRDKHTAKQRNAAAAAALGIDDSEFAAVCLAAAAAEEGAMSSTAGGGGGGSSGLGGGAQEVQQLVADMDGRLMVGNGGPGGAFSLVYDEYGGHILGASGSEEEDPLDSLCRRGRHPDEEEEAAAAREYLRENHLAMYGEQIPMRNLVAQLWMDFYCVSDSVEFVPVHYPSVLRTYANVHNQCFSFDISM